MSATRGSTSVLERILREHMELHGLVRARRVESAAGDISPAALRTLGDLLHDHVPVEERELFEAIERIVPAAEREAATHETEALSPRLSPEA